MWVANAKLTVLKALLMLELKVARERDTRELLTKPCVIQRHMFNRELDFGATLNSQITKRDLDPYASENVQATPFPVQDFSVSSQAKAATQCFLNLAASSKVSCNHRVYHKVQSVSHQSCKMAHTHLVQPGETFNAILLREKPF